MTLCYGFGGQALFETSGFPRDSLCLARNCSLKQKCSFCLLGKLMGKTVFVRIIVHRVPIGPCRPTLAFAC